MKTWISEETGPEATIEALLSVLPYFRISRARANEILSRIERALSKWRETGLALGMTRQELDQFADAFAPARSPNALSNKLFPDPVSPVMTFRPDSNFNSRLSIKAKSRITRYINIYGLIPNVIP